MRIYLDHAATTPLLPASRDALFEGLRIWANPSSPHAEGRAARAAFEDTRARIKTALEWDGELIFTSGASEALALAIRCSKRPLAAASAVEHDAVLRQAAGVELLPVDTAGAVVLPEKVGGLVAVQHVNNETGVIQPLTEIAAQVRFAGGWLLADCAQSAGKLALPDADMIVLSAHKFGGPIGIGALLLRDFAMLEPSGGQERGYRPGTENLPGAMAMAAALEQGAGWLSEAAELRRKLDGAVEASGGTIIARSANRLPTISAYRMPGVPSAAQLIRFDGLGFAVSAGSACSSGTLKASHVLKAMSVEGASEVIRVSIGCETSAADMDAFIGAWQDMAASGRRAA